MKAFFKVISALVVFAMTFTAAVAFFSEKAKESRYIVVDDNNNELF